MYIYLNLDLEGMSELCGVITARLWHEAQLNRNMHETYCKLIVISLSSFEINTPDMVIDHLCENIAEPSPLIFRLKAIVPNVPPLCCGNCLRCQGHGKLSRKNMAEFFEQIE